MIPRSSCCLAAAEHREHIDRMTADSNDRNRKLHDTSLEKEKSLSKELLESQISSFEKTTEVESSIVLESTDYKM